MRTELKHAKLLRVVAIMIALSFTAAACGSDSSGEAATDADDPSTTMAEGMEDGEHDDDHDEHDDHDDDHGDMDQGDEGHSHDHDEALEVPDSMTVPSIEIETEADPVDGVNLFIDIDDFEIAPRSASTDPVDGEGHLHLYIDGERTLRFYNTALHLPDLAEGEHEITVEISANNHSAYAVDGEPIRATTTIAVPPSEGHAGHEEMDGREVEGDAPLLALEVFEDPKSGWNVLVDSENLEFAPRSAGLDAVEGEGHLHLMIDGVKVDRLYGPATHVSDLDPGEHEIMVVAYHNDHAPYTVDGTPVSAMATVTVEEPAEVDMSSAVVIETTIVDGQIETTSGDQSGDRITVGLDETVTIMVTGDVTDEVHVHGYDLLGDVTADGDGGTITFVADVPGVFEVELESAGTFLFEIQVDS